VESYSISNIEWKVGGFSSSSTFLDIYDKVAIVKKANLSSLVKPGFETNITISGKLNDGTVVSARTLFRIAKADILIIITSNIQGDTVPFNETVVLNNSNSYDPDQPTKYLTSTWSYQGGTYTLKGSSALILTPF
jgi:hypothetical protein